MVFHARAPALTLAALIAACAAEPAPSVDCHQVVWAKPETAGDHLSAIGSWNGYAPPGIPLEQGTEGFDLAVLSLAPGTYGYRIVEDGASRLDAYAPLSMYRGDEEVSLLVARDCHIPELHVNTVQATDAGHLTISGTFLRGTTGGPLEEGQLTARLDDEPLPRESIAVEPSLGTFTLHANHLAMGKHTVVVMYGGAPKTPLASAEVLAWVRPGAETWGDGLLYQIVVDRFRDSQGEALAAPKSPGARAGGSLDGITAEIERGSFEALGVSALWLSPLYENPDDFLPDRGGNLAQGYHGYWPLASRRVDPHLGGEDALRRLLSSAHRRGLRVLFDLVPNHVYIKNPRYSVHLHDGFFNNDGRSCICGDPGCSFPSSLETCWFAPYLPDVRYQSEAATEAAADDAVFWVKGFGADGVRIDAVPMMPRSATRRIVHALRDAIAPRDSLFSLGEIFTGRGPQGTSAIRYYLGPDGLDSAFDFPLMWAIRDVLARGTVDFTAIEDSLTNSDDVLRGSGALLARMLDNHDTPRFISESNGDGSLDPWRTTASLPMDPGVFVRHRMALGLLLTLPGLPVIYYGDEVGLPGGSDPDSRRVFPAEDALATEQKRTLSVARRLGQLRRCLPALRRGTRVPVPTVPGTYAYLRDADDGSPALALFSARRLFPRGIHALGSADAADLISLPGDLLPPGDYLDVLTSEVFSFAGETTVPLGPLSFRVLIRSTNPCR